MEIYSMNADGTNQTRLTVGSNAHTNLSWSPTANKIMYEASVTGNFNICTLNSDGSNRNCILPASGVYTGAHSPVWSPDGSKIAYVMYAEIYNQELFVMNSDGTGQTRLTINPAEFDESPAWSPDGTRIIFVRYDYGGPSEIYAINVNGTNETRLTFSQSLFSDGSSGAPIWPGHRFENVF